MRHDPSAPPEAAQADAARSQIELIYELLDAHDDTSRLAAVMGEIDRDWEFHLDYLRALQRKGREAVAQLALDVKQ